MQKLYIFVALLLVATAAHAQQVYRWVDAEGVVHYSDQPPPEDSDSEAELVEVRRATVYRGPRVDTRPTPSQSSPQQPAADPDTPRVYLPGEREEVIYEQVIISRPTEQQVIWNIATRLPVEVRVVPALASGHQVRFKMDGQTIGEPQSLTSTILEPVYRGEHKLEAEILDESGTVVFRSPPTVFYVQQASILN